MRAWAILGIIIGAVWSAAFYFLLVTIVLLFAAVLADAHSDADWIAKGGFRNKVTQQFCCGPTDCSAIRGVQSTTMPTPGYRWGVEFIPQAEAQPSPDGQFWRCADRTGKRTCFFAPPPNT